MGGLYLQYLECEFLELESQPFAIVGVRHEINSPEETADVIS